MMNKLFKILKSIRKKVEYFLLSGLVFISEILFFIRQIKKIIPKAPINKNIGFNARIFFFL